MMKIHERRIPDSRWNKAKDDEVIFVLRSKDRTMGATIRAWIDFRVKAGLNNYEDEQIQEALATATLVDKLNGVWSPLH